MQQGQMGMMQPQGGSNPMQQSNQMGMQPSPDTSQVLSSLPALPGAKPPGSSGPSTANNSISQGINQSGMGGAAAAGQPVGVAATGRGRGGRGRGRGQGMSNQEGNPSMPMPPPPTPGGLAGQPPLPPPESPNTNTTDSSSRNRGHTFGGRGRPRNDSNAGHSVSTPGSAIPGSIRGMVRFSNF